MIFYFSGTGNTRWAAEQLAEATHDQLAFMAEHPFGSFAYSLQPGERLGFCFPVHGWRPPKFVRDFISRLQINAEGHYVYVLCTAGDTLGETLDIFKADLQAINIHVDAECSLLMPESYVGLPFMDVDPPQREKEKIETAQGHLNTFKEQVVNRIPGDFHIVRGRWPRINSRLIGGYFINHLISDKPFHVDSSLCVKCGICADVCPVHDIIGGLGYEPQWRHDGSCLTCFTCYHHCPHHAIQFGSATKKKGQYFFGRRQLRNNS